MQIAILLLVIFIVFFILFFKMVSKGNKQESGEEKLGVWGLLFVVFMLTLIPVVLVAFIVVVLLGSTNVINLIFSLDISTKQIIYLAIALFIYLFTLDNIFQMVGELLIGKGIGSIVLMLLIRTFAFYLLMLFIGLNQTSGFTMAIGVAIIIALMEVTFYFKEREKSS